MDQSVPVSRWGSDDQAGAANQPYFICLNHQAWASEEYERENAGATNGIGWAQVRIELDMHTGMHVDALGHATVFGAAYNRLSLADVYGNWRPMKLGIENLPPLLTRGVLVDAAGHRGREMQAGNAISEAELRAVAPSRSTSRPTSRRLPARASTSS